MISAGVPAATTSPAVDARPRADVHDIIRRAHRVLVVLDDDERVAEVAQTLAASRAACRCRAGAVRCSARRGYTARPSALLPICVASRMRWLSPPESVAARARKRQVVQTDRLQKAEAVFDLLQNALADTQLLLGKREGIDKRRSPPSRSCRVNSSMSMPPTVTASDSRRRRVPLAGGAGALAHALLQLRAHALALRLADSGVRGY